MCANAGTCASVCLKNTGMNVFPASALARANRTASFVDEKGLFLAKVEKEIERVASKAKKLGFKFAFRPNLLSDRPDMAISLATKFPSVQFYDYTKLQKPWTRVKSNYHITASFSERMTLSDLIETIDNGVNVAVVFNRLRNDDLPESITIKGKHIQVIDGDKHDLRFLDPTGVIVGLRFKGSRTNMEAGIKGGFVMSV